MEWARPVLWPASAFSVLLAAALIALVWSRRQVRVADWLLFVGFAAAALTAQRNLVLAGIVAPIMLASYLPWKFRVPAATPLVVAVLLAGGTVWGAASGSLFQFRAAEWKIPRGAADFLVAHQVPGPLFNTYEYGGYLIWRLAPRLGVFIDGRALSESVFQDYARILYNHDSSDGQTSGEELLERYGVQTIVMNTLEASNGLVYLLAPSLADPSQSKWKLVYDDAEAVVFVRTLPPGVTALNSLDVLTHMENECAVHLAREPEYPRCARALGQIFGKISDYGRARKWIGVYLGYPHAPDAEARDAYRRLLEMGQ